MNMLTTQELLYTPHPTGDPLTPDDVNTLVNEANVVALITDSQKPVVDVVKLLTKVGLIDPMYPDSPEYMRAYRTHEVYVGQARDGGIVNPGLEAEIIVEKAATRPELD